MEFLAHVDHYYYDDRHKVEKYMAGMGVIELQDVHRLISAAFNSLCIEYKKRGYIK